MKKIILPAHYNYIGVFLTLRCGLGCSYCLNRYDKFFKQNEMAVPYWLKGLSRIKTREDLPLTLQGGEPTMYEGFYDISQILHQRGKHLDLLTNGMFDIDDFRKLPANVFKRKAKYASIRFSFHKDTDPYVLAMKAWYMQNKGYQVGIWGLGESEENNKMAKICRQLNIDFRLKEFLAENSGTYKYPEAHLKKFKKKVSCKPSEFLISPSGYIHRCHADLYAGRNPIGHILDKKIEFQGFFPCSHYGHCNPCDIKLKTNRFQEGGHCSVEIKL